MERSLIQQYATQMVKSLVEQVQAVAAMNHRLTKGRLRELFVTNVLSQYLTAQFGIGGGIIVNQERDQSKETDILIYDNRILPPFIKAERFGVFPIEAVVATIEVKSRLTASALRKADEAAGILRGTIAARPAGPSSNEDQPRLPTCSVLGFCDGGVADLGNAATGKEWLRSNIRNMSAICLAGSFVWIKIRDRGWTLQESNEFYEDMKRYLAVLLDNVRTDGEHNYRVLSSGHRDWITSYTRDGNRFDSPEAQAHEEGVSHSVSDVDAGLACECNAEGPQDLEPPAQFEPDVESDDVESPARRCDID